MMKTRSSLMRSNISFCLCAGWGDIDFVNRWCMEVTNHSQTTTVILPINMRVAQIIFFYTGVPTRSYSSKGKYQGTNNIKELIENWSPETILPKLYKD